MDAQLKKGILEMCILYVVQQREMYGYDIMKYMSVYFPEVDESTFYAILRRLNKEGLAEVYFGQESNGPRRKYYRITEQGKVRLSDSILDWERIKNVVSDIGVCKKE